MSHGFSPPDNKKAKILSKPRDSKYFKLHRLALSACNFRYLIPPTALKFDAQLRCACVEIKQQKFQALENRLKKAKSDRNSSSVLTSAERLVKPPVSLRLGPVRVLSVHRTLIHSPHAAPLPAGEG